MPTELLKPEVWKAVTNPLPQNHIIIMSLTSIPQPRRTLRPVGVNTTIIHLRNCLSVFESGWWRHLPSDLKVFGTLHVLHSKFPGVTAFGLEVRHIQTVKEFVKCFNPTQKTDEVRGEQKNCLMICISRQMLTFYSLLVTWFSTSLAFNNCTLCPHCIYVSCIYLRTN